MRVAVLNVVGLSQSLIGPASPNLRAYAESAGLQSFAPEFPAVTCTAQSSMVTGQSPTVHGIVGNGWYDRESAEVRFWKQSNGVVASEKLWHTLRREVPGFTCAKLFWWYNMHADVDYSITPRPLYPADGRKFFDVHTQPMSMREEIKRDLGPFPFPSFWGPGAGIPSSQWIAESAKWVENKHQPTLSLVYLPHLDYPLQKVGPNDPSIPHEVAQIDAVVGDLLGFYRERGIEVLVVSEYGISAVNQPIHLNREFRKRGWLSIKDELGLETLDYGGCQAFAVADHQVAHVYVRNPEILSDVKSCIEQLQGVESVCEASDIWPTGKGRERAGDLIAIATENAWFTYYYWQDDRVAPDFARTVDIHRKPGYDPCELFLDPNLRMPKCKIAMFLLKKKLGIRGLLDVIPLQAELVKGSHGRANVPTNEQPVVIGAHQTITSATDLHREIIERVKNPRLP